jgi:hypothetical protein
MDSGKDHFETIIRAGGELWNFRYYLAVNGMIYFILFYLLFRNASHPN